MAKKDNVIQALEELNKLLGQDQGSLTGNLKHFEKVLNTVAKAEEALSKSVNNDLFYKTTDEIESILRASRTLQVTTNRLSSSFSDLYKEMRDGGPVLNALAPKFADVEYKLRALTFNSSKHVRDLNAELDRAFDRKNNAHSISWLSKNFFGGDLAKMQQYMALLRQLTAGEEKIRDLQERRASSPEYTTFQQHLRLEGLDAEGISAAIGKIEKDTKGRGSFAAAVKLKELGAENKEYEALGIKYDYKVNLQRVFGDTEDIQKITQAEFRSAVKAATILVDEMTTWTQDNLNHADKEISETTSKILEIRSGLSHAKKALASFDAAPGAEKAARQSLIDLSPGGPDVTISKEKLSKEDFLASLHGDDRTSSKKPLITDIPGSNTGRVALAKKLGQEARDLNKELLNTDITYEQVVLKASEILAKIEDFKLVVDDITTSTEEPGRAKKLKEYSKSLERTATEVKGTLSQAGTMLAAGTIKSYQDPSTNLAYKHAGPQQSKATTVYERALAGIYEKEADIGNELKETLATKTEIAEITEDEVEIQKEKNAKIQASVGLVKESLKQQEQELAGAKDMIDALDEVRKKRLEAYARATGTSLSTTATPLQQEQGIGADMNLYGNKDYLSDEQIIKVSTGTATLYEYQMALRGIKASIADLTPMEVEHNQHLYTLRDTVEDLIFSIDKNLHGALKDADAALNNQEATLEEVTTAYDKLDKQSRKLKQENAGYDEVSAQERLVALEQKRTALKEERAMIERDIAKNIAIETASSTDATLGSLKSSVKTLETYKLDLLDKTDKDELDEINSAIGLLRKRLAEAEGKSKDMATTLKEVRKVGTEALQEYMDNVYKPESSIAERKSTLELAKITPGTSAEEVAAINNRLRGLALALKETVAASKKEVLALGTQYNEFYAIFSKLQGLSSKEIQDKIELVAKDLAALDGKYKGTKGTATYERYTGLKVELSALKLKLKEVKAEEDRIAAADTFSRGAFRDSHKDRSIDELKDSYAELTAKINQYRDAAKLAGVAMTTGSKQTVAALEIERDEVNKLIKLRNEEAKAAEKAAKEADKASEESASGGGGGGGGKGKGRAFGPLGDPVYKLARYLTSGYMIFKGLKAMFNVFKVGAKQSLEFEKSLANLNAVTQATSIGFTEMYSSIKQAAVGTNKSLSEIADTATVVAKLGYSSYEVAKMIKPITDFTVATGESTEAVGNLLGATLKSFELDFSKASEVVDMFAKSMNASAISFDYLNTSMKIIGPVARSVNLGLSDTLGYLGVLANAGLDASRGATALRNILLHMADSSSAMAKHLGFTVKSTGDVTKAFNVLNKSSYNLGDTLELTDKRSVAAFNRLLSAPKEVAELTGKINNASGSVKAMREKQLDSTIVSWQTLTKATSNWFDTLFGSWSKVKSFFTDLRQEIDAANMKMLLKQGGKVTSNMFGISGMRPGYNVDKMSKSAERKVDIEYGAGLFKTYEAELKQIGLTATSGIRDIVATLNNWLREGRMKAGVEAKDITVSSARLMFIQKEADKVKKAFDAVDPSTFIDTLNSGAKTWEAVAQEAQMRFITLPNKTITEVRDRIGFTPENYEAKLKELFKVPVETFLAKSESYQANKKLMTTPQDKYEITMDEVAYKLSTDAQKRAIDAANTFLTNIYNAIIKKVPTLQSNDFRDEYGAFDPSKMQTMIGLYGGAFSTKDQDALGLNLRRAVTILEGLPGIAKLSPSKPNAGLETDDRWAKFLEKVKSDKAKALSSKELKVLEDESEIYKKIANDVNLSYETRKAASRDWLAVKTKHIDAQRIAELKAHEEGIRLEYMSAKDMTSMNQQQHAEYLRWYNNSYVDTLKNIDLKYTLDYATLFEDVSKTRIGIADKEYTALDKISKKRLAASLKDIETELGSYEKSIEQQAIDMKQLKSDNRGLNFFLFTESEAQMIDYRVALSLATEQLAAANEKLALVENDHEAALALLNARRKEIVMSDEERLEAIERINKAVESGSMSAKAGMKLIDILEDVGTNGTINIEALEAAVETLDASLGSSTIEAQGLYEALAKLARNKPTFKGDWGQEMSAGQKKVLDNFKAISEVAINYSTEWNNVIIDGLNNQLDLMTTRHEKMMEMLDKEHAAELDRFTQREKLISESAAAGLLSEAEAETRSKILAEAREAREKQMADQKQLLEDKFNKKKVDTTRKIAKFEKANNILAMQQGAAIAMINAAALMAKNPVLGAAMMVAVGALTAAQIATEVSRPLPQYARGTQYHRGGPAIVGDGGRAEVIITPSKPTVMDLPKGSKVLPDAAKFFANRTASFNGAPIVSEASSNYYQDLMLGKLTEQSVAELRGINKSLTWLLDSDKRAALEATRLNIKNNYK